MKNLLVIAVLACAAAGAAFAQTAPADTSTPAPSSAPAPAASAPAPAAVAPAQTVVAPASAPVSYVEQELAAAAAEISSNQVGTMTVSDLQKIALHLAIAAQKDRYVERARTASFILPGVGQFMTGDSLGGWLFVAWDVTILAGTLLSAYFVLPANVQFGSLDYLHAPISTIQNAWNSNSVISYLPLAGVIAGGVILEVILKHVSADNAERNARRNIAEGKVTFQPTLDLGGGPGLGMRMLF